MPPLRLPRRPKRLARVPRPPSYAAPERRYVAFLRDYVQRMHELTMARLRPALDAAAARLSASVAPRVDDDETTIDLIWQAISEAKSELHREVPEGRMAEEADRVGRAVAAEQKEGLARQVKSLVGVDPLISDEGLTASLALFRRGNVELIKSIDQRYFSEVEGVVQRGFQSGRRPEEMAREIASRYEVSLSRANLIAKDQVGKLAGQMDRLRQTDLGVTHYIWRTAKDERVRDEHAEREGERFAWEDPPEDGHPGEPIRCRCYAEPDIGSLLARLETEEGQPSEGED